MGNKHKVVSSKFGNIKQRYNSYARVITIFALACILSVSGVLVAKVSTDYNLNKKILQEQMYIAKQNKQRMFEENQKNLDNLRFQVSKNRDVYGTDISRMEQIFDRAEILNQSLYQGQDIKDILNDMLGFLTDKETDLLVQTLGLEKDEAVATRGKVGIKLYVYWDTGYLTGNIMSALFGVMAGALLGAAAMANPFVAVIVFAAGWVIGDTIAKCVNNWIINTGGDIREFYFVLLDAYIKIPLINLYPEKNLLDIVFSLISLGGGKAGSGLRPSGVSRPVLVYA